MAIYICNNVPRDLLSWSELTEKERAEFDYISRDEAEEGGLRFFRYLRNVHDTHEFLYAPEFPEWHGVSCDTFFSAVFIRYVEDGERVIAARYFSS